MIPCIRRGGREKGEGGGKGDSTIAEGERRPWGTISKNIATLRERKRKKANDIVPNKTRRKKGVGKLIPPQK